MTTQSEKKQTFSDFKAALRSFEDTERARATNDSILQTVNTQSKEKEKCYSCGQPGHFSCQCPNKDNPKTKRWCKTCQSPTHSDSTCRRKAKIQKNKNENDQANKAQEKEHSFAFQMKAQQGVTKNNTQMPNKLLVDCGETAHIITDESKFSSFDQSFKHETHYIELADGTRSNNVALKRGDVELPIMDSTGRSVTVSLKNALYIPSYPQDIFSVQAATERRASIVFHPEAAELFSKGGTKFSIKKYGKLYYLHVGLYSDAENVDSLNYVSDLKSWHAILGHCNYEDVVKLKEVIDGIKISDSSSRPDCETCILAKMTQSRNRNPDVRSKVDPFRVSTH